MESEVHYTRTILFATVRKCACAVLAVDDNYMYIFTLLFLCTNVSYVKFTEGFGYSHSLAKYMAKFKHWFRS